MAPPQVSQHLGLPTEPPDPRALAMRLESFIKASSAPRWQLPAVKEIEALASNLDTHLNTNPELGRAMLRRWLNDGMIKIDETADGEVVADLELMPGRIVIEVPVRSRRRKEKDPEVGSDLRANPLISLSSGGAIARANTWQSFRIRLEGPPKATSGAAASS